MPVVALAAYGVYLVVAFAVRIVLQYSRTGESGFRGVSGRTGSAEWVAGVLLLVALGIGVAAPVLALEDVVEPAAALDTTALHATGIALFAVGLAATFAAQLSMGESWRIGVDASERTALVTGGPFALVRNPIYAGMLPTSVGLALMVPSWVAGAGVGPGAAVRLFPFTLYDGGVPGRRASGSPAAPGTAPAPADQPLW